MDEKRKIFNDANLYVNDMILALSKNPQIIGLIIKYNNYLEIDQNISKTLMNSFHDNKIDEEIWN